ncbi:MAG TPA: Nif3-like dinuclear metal center hexameric protein [Candidatus Limnocylindria bacterium]|nr:Nif3-like dinuclear metal center hexameric protein [Candidatus Limnocylindria bacterium]
MSVPLDNVVAFLDAKLETHTFDEEGSNGLVLRGSETVSRVACAVNTSFHAITRAKFTDADLLIVHHRTWAHIDLDLMPQKLDRLKDNGISLYGAHSALDGAAGFGNPDLLAAALGVMVEERFLAYHGGMAGVVGRHDRTFAELSARMRDALGEPIDAWENVPTCKRVAIATGGAGNTSMLEEARQRGADTYITGEGSMYTKLYARERGINLIFGSHWATETLGVKGLASQLQERFGLPWVFIAEQDDIR